MYPSLSSVNHPQEFFVLSSLMLIRIMYVQEDPRIHYQDAYIRMYLPPSPSGFPGNYGRPGIIQDASRDGRSYQGIHGYSDGGGGTYVCILIMNPGIFPGWP